MKIFQTIPSGGATTLDSQLQWQAYWPIRCRRCPQGSSSLPVDGGMGVLIRSPNSTDRIGETPRTGDQNCDEQTEIAGGSATNCENDHKLPLSPMVSGKRRQRIEMHLVMSRLSGYLVTSYLAISHSSVTDADADGGGESSKDEVFG
jgi:hypothetical protein